MQLYLIRHGQSQNNILTPDTNHLRVSDPDLTELGQQQAEVVAQHLADFRVWGKSYGITHLYCSAMRRTLQTTQPIAKALNLIPEVWVDIHERGGIFLKEAPETYVGYPGMTRSQIQNEFPDYILPDEVTENGWWNVADGMEDELASQYRAMKVAAALRSRMDTADCIALVTHGGFMDILLMALTRRLPVNEELFHFIHHNTAITAIRFYKEETVLYYTNRTEHLPPDLRS